MGGTLLAPRRVTIYKPLFCSFILLTFLSSNSPLTAKAGTSNNIFAYLAHSYSFHQINLSSNYHNVRLLSIPERVLVRQRDGLFRHLGRPRIAHPARQGWSIQLPPCHQERCPHPMAPHSWHEDLDALAASPPKVSAVAVSPSSQDDRGFTRGEESFTIITTSPLILRNVATSADVLRHDRSLHASSHFL